MEQEQTQDYKEDSFDFDNSAELDKIISKYESQLSDSGKEKEEVEKQLASELNFDDMVDDLDQVEREVSQLSLTPKNAETVKKEDELDVERTIDEFIKQHLEEPEKKKPVEKEKHNDSLSDSDDSSGQENLTPRQSLLTALLRLSAADD